jgi:drug/metabolite transporter (DMT)-like permease
VISILLAVASAVAYGCADFLGGLTARRATVLATVLIAAPASLLVELALWPLLGAEWSPSAIWWGAASGLASAAAFALLYACLAIGPMSVLSPVTALISALLPVGVGLASGETIGSAGLLGMPLALAAVVLISREPRAARSRASDAHATPPVSRTGMVLALGAGIAIALQLIFLDAAPHDSGLTPIIVGRAVSSVLVIAAALISRTAIPRAPAIFWLAAAAGALDSLANLAFLLAVRIGDLAVVAVITALYPAATVLLARVVLREHLGPGRVAGLALAAVAVSLLAL